MHINIKKEPNLEIGKKNKKNSRDVKVIYLIGLVFSRTNSIFIAEFNPELWPKKRSVSLKETSHCEESDVTGKVFPHDWTSLVCPSVMTLKEHFRGFMPHIV